MQGVRPIQTRSVSRPFMTRILVTSFVLYYYIGLAHSCHLVTALWNIHTIVYQTQFQLLFEVLGQSFPFNPAIIWLYKEIYRHQANIYHFSSVGKIHCLGSSLIGFVQSWPRWGSDNRKSSEFVHSSVRKSEQKASFLPFLIHSLKQALLRRRPLIGSNKLLKKNKANLAFASSKGLLRFSLGPLKKLHFLTVKNCQELSRTVKNCQELSKTVNNCEHLSETVKNH